MNWNRICLVVAVTTLLAVPDVVAQGQPDFSICDGLQGAVFGLCRAGVAAGCADGSAAGAACASIEDQYAIIAGSQAPWLATDKRVFATADFVRVGIPYDATTSPDTFASVEDADAICEAAAVAAGLDRGNAYKAWLSGVTSSGVVSPATRFQQASVPYVLVDGTPVAADWSDLVDGTLLNPIERDQFGNLTAGNAKGGDVWTGTQADGQASAYRCNEWKGDTATTTHPVLMGGSMLTSSYWSQSVISLSCPVGVQRESLLFCFEQ